MNGSAWLFAVLLVGIARAAPTRGVDFEQRVGESLPLAATFREAGGTTLPLGTWFRDKPVVLWFGYARCPQLCTVVADGMVSALRPLQASAGRDFIVVMVSIDPAEPDADAMASRAEAVGHYGRKSASAGWHYLTGSEASIRATADAAGFHFVHDARSGQYAHPSGFVVLTPRGRISRYFLGVDFPPKELAAAIKSAGENGIGRRISDLLLECFRGDGVGGRYGLLIWRVLGAAVAVTVLALGAGIGRLLWLERAALRSAQRKRA